MTQIFVDDEVDEVEVVFDADVDVTLVRSPTSSIRRLLPGSTTAQPIPGSSPPSPSGSESVAHFDHVFEVLPVYGDDPFVFIFFESPPPLPPLPPTTTPPISNGQLTSVSGEEICHSTVASKSQLAHVIAHLVLVVLSLANSRFIRP